jgi:hypothetical protein
MIRIAGGLFGIRSVPRCVVDGNPRGSRLPGKRTPQPRAREAQLVADDVN